MNGDRMPTTASTDTTRDAGNGGPAAPPDAAAEIARARALAARYRLEYVDMERYYVDQDLLRSIPADLMLRYRFVPRRRTGEALEIIVSDPTDLPMIDELALLLGARASVEVVRAGARKARVSGIFDAPRDRATVARLSASGIDCEDDEWIVER